MTTGFDSSALAEKTDQQLLETIADPVSYVPQAVQAATEELHRRNVAPGTIAEYAAIGQAKTAQVPNSALKGVSGWLLLFCLGLTVFSPLLTLFSLVAAYSDAPFHRFPGLLTVTVIDTLLSVGLMAFSVYAGVGLWRIRPGAVQTAKRYLLCFLGYQVIAAVLPFTAGLPSSANEAITAEVVKNVVRGVFYVAIWYSYLNGSKRVKATYES
jgi:hypothetical protein